MAKQLLKKKNRSVRRKTQVERIRLRKKDILDVRGNIITLRTSDKGKMIVHGKVLKETSNGDLIIESCSLTSITLHRPRKARPHRCKTRARQERRTKITKDSKFEPPRGIPEDWPPRN